MVLEVRKVSGGGDCDWKRGEYVYKCIGTMLYSRSLEIIHFD